MRPVNGEMYAQWLDHKKDFGSSRLSKNAGKSKFLCSTFGEQLPFVVRMTGKRLQVANISDGSLLYFAHLDGNIVDVDYLPTAEGKFGLLVGIEEDMGEAGARHSISIITTGTDEKQKKLVPIASMSIPYQITVLKTVLSDEDMKKRKNIRLNSKLSQWNNIIVVGTKWCHCYLTSLAAVEGADENDYMMYPMDEERHKKTSENGGQRTTRQWCMSSRFDSSPQWNRKTIPIRPNGFLVGFDASPRHSICLGLYEAAFRTPGYQNLPLEEKFDKPHFSPKMVHEISYGSEWVSMRPIACHRNVDGNPRRVGCSFEPNDSSLVNVSSTSVLSTVSNFGHHRNRSRAFFTYSRFNEKVKDSLTLAGGIFDVNAYYYKRFPPNLSLDRTLLKQCPFVSWIRSGLNAANVEDFAVLTDDLCDIAQMKSAISDADQLFYPSALDFDRAFVVESGILRPMHVTNLPTQVLDRIVKNLADVLVAPTSAAELLRSAGLVPASVNHLDASPTGEQELNPSEKTVLVAVLHYGRVEALVKLLKSPSITTERKMDIVKWVWNEACAFRSVINERTVSVFAGTSTALSPLASTSLVHGVRLFTDIAYFLASANVDSRFAAKFKRYEMAVRCMKSHTELVHRFVSAHLVPLSEHDAERIVQEHQKKQSAAHRNGKTLPVDFLLKRLHEKTRGMHFWMRKSPDEWYPPPPLNLLEPILNFSLDERTKRELLVYFVADWITASRTYQKSLSVEALAIKVLAVISDGMLGADLEKVKYLLSQVDLAVKRAEEKSSVASQAKENQPVESDDEIPKSELKLSDEVVEDFSDILDKKQKILTNVVSTVGDSRDDEYERRRLLFLYSQQRFAEIRNVFHDDQNKDRDDAFRQLSPYLFAGPSNKTTTVDPEEKAKADQRAATVQALFARGEVGKRVQNG
ncbi:unnamed protein product [Caenorhabditis auriculariae]|uniref:Uncharacterized protein n=1 Tax=Caenorhabditis auriculariae TaxID=2777116 RepID=A0A8S1HWN6_9PELO|nr:unnamed protein product [Caenorhabditis auriculariae]